MENINLLELQKARKHNLRCLIDEFYSGSVEGFASVVGKHKNFIYSLLWDVDNPNHRPISDKMSRLLEKAANKESGYLDRLVGTASISDYVYIKFLDILDATGTDKLPISDEPSYPLLLNDIFKRELVASDLLAVRVFDNSMVPYCDFEDIIIIDKSFYEPREQQYYLIRYNLRYLIRRLDFGVDGYVFNTEKNDSKHLNNINMEKELEKNKLDIIGIVVLRSLNADRFKR